jgi:hypothetical protein
MPLPPGTSYRDIGMSNVFKYFIFLYFCIVEKQYFWMITHISLNLEIFYYTDFINIDFFVNRHIKLR